MLMTTDWKLWRRIMSARSRYVRAERFKGFRLDPTKDHVLSLTDEREHSRLRTLMIHGVCDTGALMAVTHCFSC